MPDPEHDPTTGLSLADLVQIAEGAMERTGEIGPVFTNEQDASDWITPIADANGVRTRTIGGKTSQQVVITPNMEVWQASGKTAMVSPMGTIVVKEGFCNGLVLLHELAHLITDYTGHSPEYVLTVRDLYEKHISTRAARIFWDLMSTQPELEALDQSRTAERKGRDQLGGLQL